MASVQNGYVVKPAMSPEAVNEVLLQWKEAKEVLDAAKEKEMALRKVIVEESGLFDSAKETGTENYELGNGWKLKAEKKLDYKVDNENGRAFQVLSEIEKLDPVSAHLSKDLFGFTPSLRLAKYRELCPQAKALADSIITIKPASPSLTLIPPKS